MAPDEARKESADVPELELQMVVSSHVGVTWNDQWDIEEANPRRELKAQVGGCRAAW